LAEAEGTVLVVAAGCLKVLSLDSLKSSRCDRTSVCLLRESMDTRQLPLRLLITQGVLPKVQVVLVFIPLLLLLLVRLLRGPPTFNGLLSSQSSRSPGSILGLSAQRLLMDGRRQQGQVNEGLLRPLPVLSRLRLGSLVLGEVLVYFLA